MATLTERTRAGWMAIWFPPVPLERIAIFRIAVALFALVDVAGFSNYLLAYPDVDATFFDPVHLLSVPSLLGIEALPVPSAGGYLVLWLVMIGALAAAVVGWRTRFALAVAAPLYLYHWALFNSFGKINHGKIPLIFALFALAIAPAGARLGWDAIRRRRSGADPAAPPTHDRLAGWALRVVGVLIVGSYLLSVYAKLATTGLSWPLQPILAVQLRAAGHPIGVFLSEQPELLVVMQAATLAVEVAAVLAFVGGWPRNLVLLALSTFHVVSYPLLGTEFFAFVLCYLVFFRLEDGLDWVRTRLPGLRGARPASTGGPGHAAAP